MFKKRLTVSQSLALSGKDVKILKAAIANQYPLLDSNGLKALFPSKATVTMHKTAEKAVVYAIEGGNPVFFDPNGFKDRYYPTVYALVLAPTMVECVETWSPVTPRVLGGADLFLQGVMRPPEAASPPSFLANSVRGLCVPGNPVPFAIGSMACSSVQAAQDGWKGRGLSILHVYGDLLWAMGDGRPPNAGFTPRQIVPTPSGAEERGATGAVEPAPPAGPDAEGPPPARSDGESSDGEGDDSDGDDATEPASPLNGEDRKAARRRAFAARVARKGAGGARGEGEVPGAEGGAAPGGPSEAADAAAPALAPGPAMDLALETAVRRGLLTLKNSELPIQLSDFYSRHMVPAKPDPSFSFDLKLSKYKKLSKLLDAFAKRKVLELKTIRKEQHISKVDRSHEELESNRSEEEAGGPEPAPAAAPGAASAPASAPAPASTSGAGGAYSVEAAYRVPAAIRTLWPEGSQPDREELVSEEDVRSAVGAYVDRLGLTRPGGRAAADEALRRAIFDKKEVVPDSGVPLAALAERVLGKCTLFSKVSIARGAGGDQGAPPRTLVRRGALRPAEVAAGKRRGHPVTVVSRVEGLGLVPKDLAGALQKHFQAACSLAEVPGKGPEEQGIVLQGDYPARVGEFLAATYGIPPSLLDIKGGGGKKK